MSGSFVYEPGEDSFLLERQVRRYARGRVLDLGTGSGIQALAALESKEVTEVWAADVNKDALRILEQRTAKHPRRKELVLRETNMFSGLQEERFDTIVCNPPYLPDDPRDSAVPLDGGPHGYEWTARFLADARQHLTDGGQILLVFSSLTNKERVDLLLHELGYAFTQLEELAMFFERLYAYRAWRRA